jgi:bifunctional non-homologous end joining protein LigD
MATKAKAAPESLVVGGREVTVTSPGKLLIPQAGLTKIELARYYVAVAEGALRGSGGRPNMMVRFPDGIEGEFFYQKRAPANRPEWLEVATIRFPSGRSAEELVPRAAADLAWMANLACLELHPHPVRAEDLDHPDELRIDLDPTPGVTWASVRKVACIAGDVLGELGLRGFPKTSGKRGMHISVRIAPRWSFDQVRRSALALGREIERRAPKIATTAWWKEERHGVFIDYNQNAKDRTVAGAYSVRPVPEATVSAPLAWDEVAKSDPREFTVRTMLQRYAKVGDLLRGIDDEAHSLDELLEISARHEKDGQGDAPWPPHYAKQEGEPPRVQPSKKKAGVVPKKGKEA